MKKKRVETLQYRVTRYAVRGGKFWWSVTNFPPTHVIIIIMLLLIDAHTKKGAKKKKKEDYTSKDRVNKMVSEMIKLYSRNSMNKIFNIRIISKIMPHKTNPVRNFNVSFRIFC